MNKADWVLRLSYVRDHHGLEALVRRNRGLFSPEDRFWLGAAGVDCWPRIMRLLRQELRAQRGQEYIMEPRNGDPANAAIRRVWRPAALLRR